MRNMSFMLDAPMGLLDQHRLEHRMPDQHATQCPKCGGTTRAVRSPRGHRFVGCSRFPRCDFTVGADALTVARMRAHEVFDQVWRNHIMSRNAAYAMMARLLNIPREKAHIAMLSTEQCKKLVESLRGIVEVD